MPLGFNSQAFQYSQLPSNASAFGSLLSALASRENQKVANRGAWVTAGINAAGDIGEQMIQNKTQGTGAGDAGFYEEISKFSLDDVRAGNVPVAEIARRHNASPAAVRSVSGTFDPSRLELRQNQTYGLDYTTGSEAAPGSPVRGVVQQKIADRYNLPTGGTVQIEEQPQVTTVQPTAPAQPVAPVPGRTPEEQAANSKLLRPTMAPDELIPGAVASQAPVSSALVAQQNQPLPFTIGQQGLQAPSAVAGNQNALGAAEILQGVNNLPGLASQPLAPTAVTNQPSAVYQGGQKVLQGGLGAQVNTVPTGAFAKQDAALLGQNIKNETEGRLNDSVRQETSRVATTPTGQVVAFSGRPSNIPLGKIEQQKVEEGMGEVIRNPAQYENSKRAASNVSSNFLGNFLPTIDRLQMYTSQYGDLRAAALAVNAAQVAGLGTMSADVISALTAQGIPTRVQAQVANDLDSLMAARSNFAKAIGSESGNLSQTDVGSWDFLAKAQEYLTPELMPIFHRTAFQYVGNNMYKLGIKYNLEDISQFGYEIRQQQPELFGKPSTSIYGSATPRDVTLPTPQQKSQGAIISNPAAVNSMNQIDALKNNVLQILQQQGRR